MNQVFFYEWSNIDGHKKHFENLVDFVEFCKNSNIRLTVKNFNFVKNHETTYMVCKPGLNELIMSGDYFNLRKNFSKHRNQLNKKNNE